MHLIKVHHAWRWTYCRYKTSRTPFCCEVSMLMMRLRMVPAARLGVAQEMSC